MVAVPMASVMSPVKDESMERHSYQASDIPSPKVERHVVKDRGRSSTDEGKSRGQAVVDEGIGLPFDEAAAVELAKGVVVRVHDSRCGNVFDSPPSLLGALTPLRILGTPGCRVEDLFLPGSAAQGCERKRVGEPSGCRTHGRECHLIIPANPGFGFGPW